MSVLTTKVRYRLQVSMRHGEIRIPSWFTAACAIWHDIATFPAAWGSLRLAHFGQRVKMKIVINLQDSLSRSQQLEEGGRVFWVPFCHRTFGRGEGENWSVIVTTPVSSFWTLPIWNIYLKNAHTFCSLKCKGSWPAQFSISSASKKSTSTWNGRRQVPHLGYGSVQKCSWHRHSWRALRHRKSKHYDLCVMIN